MIGGCSPAYFAACQASAVWLAAGVGCAVGAIRVTSRVQPSSRCRATSQPTMASAADQVAVDQRTARANFAAWTGR